MTVGLRSSRLSLKLSSIFVFNFEQKVSSKILPLSLKNSRGDRGELKKARGEEKVEFSLLDNAYLFSLWRAQTLCRRVESRRNAESVGKSK